MHVTNQNKRFAYNRCLIKLGSGYIYIYIKTLHLNAILQEDPKKRNQCICLIIDANMIICDWSKTYHNSLELRIWFVMPQTHVARKVPASLVIEWEELEIET